MKAKKIQVDTMTGPLEEPLRAGDEEVNVVAKPSEEAKVQEDDDVLYVPIPPQEPIVVEDDEETTVDTNQNIETCTHVAVASTCAKTRPVSTNTARPSESSDKEPTTMTHSEEVVNTVSARPRIGRGFMLVKPRKNAGTNTGLMDMAANEVGTKGTSHLLCTYKSVPILPPTKLLHEKRGLPFPRVRVWSHKTENTVSSIAVKNSTTFDATVIGATSTETDNSSATAGLKTTEPKIVLGYLTSCTSPAGSTIGSAMTDTASNSTETAVIRTNAGSSMTNAASIKAEKCLGSAKTGIITDPKNTCTGSINPETTAATSKMTSSTLNSSVFTVPGTSGTSNSAGNSAGSSLITEPLNSPGNNAITAIYLVPASGVKIATPRQKIIITKKKRQ